MTALGAAAGNMNRRPQCGGGIRDRWPARMRRRGSIEDDHSVTFAGMIGIVFV
jgi:hypothetical protein